MEAEVSKELQKRLERLEHVEVVKSGRKVIPNITTTTLYTHLPETCLGAWWYDTVTGTLEYSTKAKSPWFRGGGEHFSLAEKGQERWIPGLVFQYPENKKIYITVYDFYLEKLPRSGKVFKDMLQKVLAALTIPVEDVLDNRGNTLLGEPVKASA